MKLLIINSLDERYGSTYRIRAFAQELKKLSYKITYYEKQKSFILKYLELKWISLFSDYDALIIQKFNPLTLAPILIAKLRGKLIIADWDDWDTGLQRNPLLKIMTWFCEKFLPYFPDLITSHNSNLLKLVPQKKQTLILEQGFDVNLFNQQKKMEASDSITVGYLCTFTRGGTLDLDAIFSELSKVKNPHIKFLMIGGGKLLENFMQKAAQLKISNIHFTDFIPHDRIPETLQKVDIGLIYMKDIKANRSRSSFKVVEYLASGLTVVGHCVGETQKNFGEIILEKPLDQLSPYLNQLQPGFLTERKVDDELLKPFTWSKIVFKLHERLQTLKR